MQAPGSPAGAGEDLIFWRFCFLIVFFGKFVLEVYNLLKYAIVLVVKVHFECTQDHVWGFLWPRFEHILDFATFPTFPTFLTFLTFLTFPTLPTILTLPTFPTFPTFPAVAVVAVVVSVVAAVAVMTAAARVGA